MDVYVDMQNPKQTARDTASSGLNSRHHQHTSTRRTGQRCPSSGRACSNEIVAAWLGVIAKHPCRNSNCY